MELILTPFTGFPEHRITFTIHSDGTKLICDYHLFGDTGKVSLDDSEGGARKLYLWLDTCFELFIKSGAGGRYYEFNFAFNGDWNVFRFDEYRGPLAESDDFTVCSRVMGITQEHLHFRTEITPAPGVLPGEFRFLPSTVVKLVSGEEFFFASDHSSPNADFHDHTTYKNRMNF